MKYKALILDIDGTLTPTGRVEPPTQRVVEAVIKAQKVVQVSVATGRSLKQATEMIAPIKLSGPSVFASGAQIIDVGTGQIIEGYGLSGETYLQVLNITKKFGKILGAYVNGEKITAEEKSADPTTVFITDLTPKEYEEIYREIILLPDTAIHKTTSWTKGCNDLHVSNEKAQKDLALLKVAEMLNIKPEEMIGVGDGPNDLSLIKVCGLKVALGDAVPELKALA